jgi:hypothetical protein
LRHNSIKTTRCWRARQSEPAKENARALGKIDALQEKVDELAF